MKLSERITQLAKLGVRYSSFSKFNDRESHDVYPFEGEFLIARFDDGEGVELINSGNICMPAKEDDFLYVVLKAEIGEDNELWKQIQFDSVGRAPPGSVAIRSEGHSIFDMKTGIRYDFMLPSRAYLKD